MKKTYNNPVTKVVRINPIVMQATSQLGVGESYNGGVIQSRRGRNTYWEDDEE